MRYDSKERIIDALIAENPVIVSILSDKSINNEQMIQQIRDAVLLMLREHPKAYAYYRGEAKGEKSFFKLSWHDLACMRVLDYLEHEGEVFADQNLRGEAGEFTAVHPAAKGRA